MEIYFDNAATTPPLESTPCGHLGNPSSPHAIGIATERKLSDAREDIAAMLKCNGSEIVFTSGGTESNNLALIGYALSNHRRHVTFMAQPWEHPSVLEPLHFIKTRGLGNVVIAPYETWHDCDAPFAMAVLSHVNHETGDINDIHAMTAALKTQNPNITVHVDGVQGFCKEPANLVNIDTYALSAHKCHGPTGVGALMVRSPMRLTPLLYGGGQENKLRPGTENTGGILQMAEIAKQLYHHQEKNHRHVAAIKSELALLANELANVTINSKPGASPYILNMSFLGIKGEVLVHLLSQKGIFVSMGAACRSRKNTKTTLESMGLPPHVASAAIRFSFSHLNTLKEAAVAKKNIIQAVTQLRRVIAL